MDKFLSVWLDPLGKIAEIVTAGSLIVALIEYRYKRGRDKMSSIADQISFFRKEIIVKHTELISLIKNVDSTYKFPRLELEVVTIKESRSKHLKIVQEQSNIIKRDAKIFSCQGELLNMLEELAIRIIYLKTEKHEALNSIRSPFVEAVEQNMVALLMKREVFGGTYNYKTIINLYYLWKEGVDRRTYEERSDELVKELANSKIQ